MQNQSLKVGVIGCGNIFPHYLKNANKFDRFEIVACASRNFAAAEANAAEFGLHAMGVDELLEDRELGLILNLTSPKSHAEVSMRALRAGKHVYSEKPLALGLEEARKLLDLAAQKNLRIGCAPDTILGDSHQACRKIIDAGVSGRVLSGTAFMMSRGPEAWHPNPFFFYQHGGGPMMDIGPYYISALVNFLGPIRSVVARVTQSIPERVAGAEPHVGKIIPVEVPTCYAGVLEFHNGHTVSCNLNWETWKHSHSPIELYGTTGSVIMPDPSQFGGQVKVFKSDGKDWEDTVIPERYPFSCRLLGVADMVHSLANGTPHACSGELAYHVLEVMLAFETSSAQKKVVSIQSTCDRPHLLPETWK